VGDNVYFGPGAKVIGDTKVGNNVVVAANSLVITDVADNTTVIGVPARPMPGGQPKRFPTEMPVEIGRSTA
jgi:serine O-acetyltransferase